MLTAINSSANSVNARERDIQRLAFICFFEIFRQTLCDNRERAKLMHRMWEDVHVISQRILREAKREKRNYAQQLRRMRKQRRCEANAPLASACQQLTDARCCTDLLAQREQLRRRRETQEITIAQAQQFLSNLLHSREENSSELLPQAGPAGRRVSLFGEPRGMPDFSDLFDAHGSGDSSGTALTSRSLQLFA